MQQWRRVALMVGTSVVVTATAIVSAGVGGVGAASKPAGATVSSVSLVRVGTKNVRALAERTAPRAQSGARFLLGPSHDGLIRGGGAGSPAAPVTNLGVTSLGHGSHSSPPGAQGFVGITGAEQAAANAAYDLEPPDQGLCSNGTYVVEDVNNAYAVYTTTGQEVLSPVAMTSLFGIPSETAGSFTSDPRCYYDTATQRWFVVELSIPNFFAAHRHATTSYELIAVSQTSKPTGNFTTFAIPTADQSDPGCPCFGDYPMIGADSHGFYLTTNEFSIYRSNYNGVQLYAVSKQGLEAAADGMGSMPTVVHFGSLPSPFPGENATVGETYHLSPALTPGNASFDASNGGTEFFTMSDVFPVSASDLAVYALTNTSSLASSSPDLTLTDTVVPTQTYTFPEIGMAVAQKPVPSGSRLTPLANYVATQTGTAPPEGVLQADFDAVEQTTYTGGHLYTELSSAVSSAYSSTYQTDIGTTSAEWFILSASASQGAAGVTVNSSLVNQGNVGVSGQSLLYPDVVVNGSGAGDMVFTLVGSKHFPSAAYVAFGSSGVATKASAVVAAAGSGPEDGFTCYAYFVGPSYGGCRWGDFSGGVAVGNTVWMATEFIPPQSYRDFYTNWGTFIFSAPAG